jgi:predicted DNA-binding transcriptional regulator YafY
LSRSQRLLALLQHLRRHRWPVSGASLAAEMGISLRTLYRDIATLQSQGARIDGAAGLGYVLQEGFLLPPLMFSDEEIEALVLGSRWVAEHGDSRLSDAAGVALAKIAAVLPAELRHRLDSSGLLVGPGATNAPVEAAPDGDRLLALLRDAIRDEVKLGITYRDADGKVSERTLWPFALGFFEGARVLVAWCEWRQAIRHFRSDRIVSLRPGSERYPQRRQALLKAWRLQEGIAAP